jgi:hypothetical protein
VCSSDLTIGLGNPTAAAGDHLLHYRLRRRGGGDS